MRQVIVYVALLALCAAVVVSADSPLVRFRSVNLKKPIILNPMDSPNTQDGMAKIAAVLAKEPVAARTPAAGEGEDGDEESGDEGSDDVNLFSSDSVGNKEGSESAKGEEGSAESGAPGAGKGGEIQALEKLIAHAMKISKQIPQKVARLQGLKKKEESAMENKAKSEAMKTLKEHQALLKQLTAHIGTLQGKLQQLTAKKDQLQASDSKLQRDITGQKGVEKVGEGSEGSKAEGSEASKGAEGSEASKGAEGSKAEGSEASKESSEESSEASKKF
eukprot:TRINITY_DN29648_c0_g1_i1.p1 TRINITY_DN29648_c0_g1~~TRINITY_DN29648_c0_g1_i1.p1  ORF type:complete len:291 (+),score=180.34 TRINITY_DN29648_c0_g1_i1:47-874(+)